MTQCSECGGDIPKFVHEGDPDLILAAERAWCSVECWEATYDYDWPHA